MTEPQTQQYSDPIEWLRAEYIRRKTKNPQYSMRSFANSLDINSGRLSQLFNRKRNLTFSMGKKLSGKLSFSPAQQQQFLKLIEANKKTLRTKLIPEEFHYTNLDEDKFAAIADWHHFAILNLIKTSDFQSEPKWIAQRLGLSVVEVQTALERLKRLELISMHNNSWKRTKNSLMTTDDISSAALRASHKQSIEQAAESLENVNLEFRDVTSMTLAMDTAKIPKAKQLIRKFYKDFSRLVDSKNCNEVYNLNIQLHPITRIKNHD